MGSVHSLEQARMDREQDLGYIKLYRSLKHVSFKRDPYKVALWQHMLLEATYKPHSTILGGKAVELMPGQFISGLRDLEKETGVPFQRVRSALKFFEQEGMIEMDTSSRSGTVFTVSKFSEYQAKNTQKTNTPSTHQINTQDNTLEARDCKAYKESATHQTTQQQHTSATPIQENNNLKPIDNSYELSCSDLPSEPEQSSEKNTSKYPACPHKEILALWAEIIPETVQHNPSAWSSERSGYKNLAKRWKAGFVTKKSDNSGMLYTDRESGLQWWESFFRWMRKSDFLINDCNPFCLEWVVKLANFNKVKEGNYHA